MLLELQNLGKSFGEHEVLRDVNAGVERGDRIGIIGANGTGKTTLLRILCGESLPDAGDAAFGTGVTTGYLEQNARLDPSLDIYATMRLVFTPALDAMQEMDALQKQLAADPHNAELTEKIAHCTAVIDAMDAYNMDTQIKKVLNGMGFPADTWTKLAGVLSGGEKRRVALCRLLLASSKQAADIASCTLRHIHAHKRIHSAALVFSCVLHSLCLSACKMRGSHRRISENSIALNFLYTFFILRRSSYRRNSK